MPPLRDANPDAKTGSGCALDLLVSGVSAYARDGFSGVDRWLVDASSQAQGRLQLGCRLLLRGTLLRLLRRLRRGLLIVTLAAAKDLAEESALLLRLCLICHSRARTLASARSSRLRN